MTLARRIWAVSFFLVLAGILGYALHPTKTMRDQSLDLAQMIPATFGDWQVDPTLIPVVPTPDVQANLDKIYDQIVNRTYINRRGERVMLSIAYGGDQSDALKAHRQEVCYAAQGFRIADVHRGDLNIVGRHVPVTRMHAVMGQRSEPVTYWFTMGDKVVYGRVERMLVQIGYGLRGVFPDGLLVRVSNLSTNTEASFAAHVAFLDALTQAMPESSVARLLGSGK